MTKNVNWHAYAVNEIFEKLNTSAEGLTHAESVSRLRTHGFNKLPEQKKTHPFIRFASQFNNVLIYILIFCSFITIGLQHWTDTTVIFGVVIINAIIGYIQEGKAEKAIESIRTMLSLDAEVIRDDKIRSVKAQYLVPGDVILLKAGDKVPADVRLILTHNFQTQEASLTGESNAIDKNSKAVETNTNLADRTSMAYSGTLVVYGRAKGVVVATGVNTEIGKIGLLMEHVERLTTPLLRKMSKFSVGLTVVIVFFAAATFCYGVFVHEYSFSEMFIAAVGLAVAAIPEGLPAVITITLAIGVTRMAKRNAIIRLLPAVESMGSVDIICTDKTGTLTLNELSVQSIITRKHHFTITGAGYTSEGEFVLNNRIINHYNYPDLLFCIRAAILCNESELVNDDDNEWRLHGNPMDGALLTLGLKAKLDINFEKSSFPHTDLIPFDSTHKLMASLHHDHEGHGYIYVKGAPERILKMCSLQRIDGNVQAIDQLFWERAIIELASQGNRVIAIATKLTNSTHLNLQFSDLDHNLILLGIFGLIDPPREGVHYAIKECQSAGINIKMITGDHALTAKAIAHQLGIGQKGTILTGIDLDLLNEQEFFNAANTTEIFARMTPQHKLRLVTALQAQGHVVAMTGDGVNDAPALKRADIGIAMGINGAEASKEVAEMVLADNNFVSIYHAIKEGRTVFNNLKKSILFTLPTNAGEAFIIILAILMGSTLPISPVQILWVNMITTVTLALAIAFEPSEKDIMSYPPRTIDEPILSIRLMWRIIFVGILLLLGTFGLFLLSFNATHDLAIARTVAVNTLVAGELIYLFNCRKIHGPSCNFDCFFGSKPILIAIGLVVLFQLLYTYTPLMQFFFDTKPIGYQDWAYIILFMVILFVLVEVEKWIMRKIKRVPAG